MIKNSLTTLSFAVAIVAGGLLVHPSAHASITVLGPAEAAGANAVTTSSQAAIGAGAWGANGSTKAEGYLYWKPTYDPGALGASLKVGDILSLDFSTFKSTTGGSAPDWYVTLYTTKDANNKDSWYGHSLTLEGLYAGTLNNPANQWNKWSTDVGVNQLNANDSNHSGNKGSSANPTWADILNGAVTWQNGSTIDYRNLDVLAISLSTGSTTSSGFTGLVDDLQIRTKTGVTTFDLEPAPVPEPTTIIAGALLLLPFGASAMRVLRKKA